MVVEVKGDPSLVLGGMVYLDDTGSCCSHLTTWEKSSQGCGQTLKDRAKQNSETHRESPDQPSPEPCTTLDSTSSFVNHVSTWLRKPVQFYFLLLANQSSHTDKELGPEKEEMIP